ncbi:MAG: hypothetical protein LUQ35_08645 [Methanoregula sp.]|nr:hypothetical protein [Methanoregula sp.]
MAKKLLFAFFLVLLFIVNVPVSAVMAASSPAPSVSVVCTPPVCPTGGTFSCPPEGNGCPGGCGVVCATPTVVCTPPPCPTGGTLSCPPAADGCPGGCGMVCTTPTIVCTPPPCPAGGTLTCPPAADGCPGGCGVVCVTPTTPASANEPLVIIGGFALCLLVIGRRSG